MATWNNVTIRAEIALDTLPDIEDFSLINEDGWSHYGAGKYLGDGKYEKTHTSFSGESKYTRDEIGTWCEEWTAANPGIAVEWSQTWDDDGQGESLDVYRDGEMVRAESKIARLTPIDLDALIADVRAAIDARVMEVRETGEPVRRPVEDAARALVDALAPEVAR